MAGSRTLTILDVGHGNSSVLRTPEGVVVIDAGPGSALISYLEKSKITFVDSVLISHADEDHIAGLLGILSSSTVSVGRVRLNSDALKGSEIWNDLAYELDAAAREGKLDFIPSLTSMQNGEFDVGGVHVEVVAPSSYLATRGPGSRDVRGRRITTNSISAVVRISYASKAVALLAGDLDEVGLYDISRVGAEVDASVLIFPHHGGRAGGAEVDEFAKKLLQMVRPSTVVFSIGRGRHGTPQPEVVRAVREEAHGAWLVCTQLSEHCASDLPSMRPEHLSESFARGRELGQCCGGSVVVDLDELSQIQPERVRHQLYVQQVAPSALCKADIHKLSIEQRGVVTPVRGRRRRRNLQT